MERRPAGRTSSPFFLSGPALALALASALIAVTGPGAAASRAPARWHTAPPSAAAQTSAIADLALDLEFDVEKIFRFVSDEIRYEPYAGILRGAVGTLDARAGNSLDRALLLAALLEESGILYRFARGPLDEATAAELIDSITTDAADARRIAEEVFVRGWDGVAGGDTSAAQAASGPLVGLYQEQARAMAADAQERLELAESRLDETVTMIEAALDGAGIDLPARDMSLPPAEVAEHTWVQVASGPAWVDLDPTFPASAPGTVLTPASETLDLLPDDLRHRLEFAVLVERVSGGQLVTETVLEYATFADQIARVPVTFGHVTPSDLKRLGVTLRNVLGDGWMDYRPTLDIGSGSVVADEALAIPLGGAGRDNGPFDDVFTDGASPRPDAGPDEGEATAEWLEVRVMSPGSEPALARRTVFDRVPADVRHGGELTVESVEPIELVDVVGTGSIDFPPMLGAETFAIATGPMSPGAVLADPTDAPGMVALAYHTLRDAMDAEMALDAGARTFVDGPNIVSLSTDVYMDGQTQGIRVSLDIWHRDHGILPLTGPSLTVPGAELVAGVTDHLAERFALDDVADVPGTSHTSIGVGEIFDAAASQAIPTVVLHGTAPESLPYSGMATDLIRQALASGDVVVVPAEPVMAGGTQRVGWWAIDPATGETTDVMDDGSGSVAVEYAELETGAVQRFVCFGAMAEWAAGVIIAAASMVTYLAESAMFRLLNAGEFGTRCFAL